MNSIVAECEKKILNTFKNYEEIALYNQNKVLQAFKNNRVSQRNFYPSTGYGYGDIGKETLCRVYAEIFGAESALVTPLIASGTHAINICLHSQLLPGEKMLCITGKPYDTICASIFDKNTGSLADYDVKTDVIDLKNGCFDTDAILSALQKKAYKYKMVYIQRSRGYEWRETICVKSLENICKVIKQMDENVLIFVDNCYCEFVERQEPIEVGVDLAAGSLIKNAGGGFAPTGGYIAGNAAAVLACSYRLTASKIGNEIGSNPAGYTSYYTGVFMAPHIVLQAVKSSLLFGEIFRHFNLETLPAKRFLSDITRAVKLNVPQKLEAFVRAIQAASPVDSFVVPYA